MQISPIPSFSKRRIKSCLSNPPFSKGEKGDFHRRMATLRDRNRSYSLIKTDTFDGHTASRWRGRMKRESCTTWDLAVAII